MKYKIIGLSVIMVLIMIGSMMVPAAMGSTGTPDEYEITVSSGQNTALLSTDTTFGTVLAGTTNEIADSFNLTNSGNAVATVSATFTTFNGSVYGLNSTSGPIGGANFSMTEAVDNTYVALDNLVTGTAMVDDVAADDVADIWKVQLIVPAGQAAATYTGTVELTFS